MVTYAKVHTINHQSKKQSFIHDCNHYMYIYNEKTALKYQLEVLRARVHQEKMNIFKIMHEQRAGNNNILENEVDRTSGCNHKLFHLHGSIMRIHRGAKALKIPPNVCPMLGLGSTEVKIPTNLAPETGRASYVMPEPQTGTEKEGKEQKAQKPADKNNQ
ncbi:hypothetical protein ACJX0J_033907 [Zea mays]